VPESEEIVSTQSAGGNEARGAAGASSNTGKTSAGSSGGGSGNKEETSTVRYRYPETIKDIESRPGAVQRLTVAVMVDLAPREGSEGRLLTEAEVEELVKSAVGFQTGRDDIKVKNAPMASAGSVPEVESAVSPWTERAQSYVQLARNVALMVAFVFLAGTVWLLARRMRAAEPPKPATNLERNGKLPSTNGPAWDTDSKRFIDMAANDPQQLARVLTALLRNSAA
jgi:flagellar M-ring protein FliF